MAINIKSQAAHEMHTPIRSLIKVRVSFEAWVDTCILNDPEYTFIDIPLRNLPGIKNKAMEQIKVGES